MNFGQRQIQDLLWGEPHVDWRGAVEADVGAFEAYKGDSEAYRGAHMQKRGAHKVRRGAYEGRMGDSIVVPRSQIAL